MKSRVISVVALVASLSSALPADLASQQPGLFQEFGVFSVTAQSDHRELPSPRGFGAASVWEFGGSFFVRLSYHRLSDDTRKEGVVCDQYSQRINCRPEMTQTSVDFSGLRGALLWSPPLGDYIRLGIGGGLSFNHIRSESVGMESGLDADLLVPNAGIIGFGTLLSAALTPVPSIPLMFTGGFGFHWVNFNTCSGNDPPQYDPYCGRDLFREIELGLSYAF